MASAREYLNTPTKRSAREYLGQTDFRSMVPNESLPDASSVDTGFQRPSDPRYEEAARRAAALPKPPDVFEEMKGVTVPGPLGFGSMKINAPVAEGLRYAYPFMTGIGEAASFGIAEPERVPGESVLARTLGEFAGMALPAEGMAQGARIGLKAVAPTLAKSTGKLATIGRRAIEGTTAGAAYGTAEQGVKVAKQEPLGLSDLVTGKEREGFSGKDVALSAGMWGGVDALLATFGIAGKMIKTAMLNSNRSSAMATLNTAMRNGVIPEEAGNTIRRAIENTGDGFQAVNREGLEAEVRGNIGPRQIEMPTPKLQARGIDEQVQPLRTTVEYAGPSPYRNQTPEERLADLAESQAQYEAPRKQAALESRLADLSTPNPETQRFGTARIGQRPTQVSLPSRFGTATTQPKMQVSEIDPSVPPKAWEGDVYRGIGKDGPTDKGHFGSGTYYSTNESVARGYGDVTKSRLRLENPYIIDANAPGGVQKANALIPEEYSGLNKETSEQIRQRLESEGYDGIVVKGWHGEGDEVVSFKRPTSIPTDPTVPKTEPVASVQGGGKPVSNPPSASEVTRADVIVQPVRVDSESGVGGFQYTETTGKLFRDIRNRDFDAKQFVMQNGDRQSVYDATQYVLGAMKKGGYSPELVKKVRSVEKTVKANSVNLRTTPPSPVGKAKEPWEMTREEFGVQRKAELDSYKAPTPNGIKDLAGIAKSSEYRRQKEYYKTWRDDHKTSVRIAISKGKPVPPEVLKDYPDLIKAKEGGTKAYSMVGGAAGVQQDEEGNITFDPKLAALGTLGGLAAIHFGGKYGKNKSTERAGSPKVETPQRVSVEPAPAGETAITYGRKYGINIDRLELDNAAKSAVSGDLNSLKDVLTKARGGTIGFDEVKEAAEAVQKLKGEIPPEKALEMMAQDLAARREMVALWKNSGGELSDELIDAITTVSTNGSTWARLLGSRRIMADAMMRQIDDNLQYRVIAKLKQLGHDTKTIKDVFQGVDWNNAKDVVKRYRQIQPASFGEIVSTFRYGNMLSSPITHSKNISTNALMTGVVTPTVKLLTGGVDAVGSALTGRARTRWASEASPYWRAFANSGKDAWKNAKKAFGGTDIGRLDLDYMPSGKTWLKPWETVGKILEFEDVFFRTLATNAEKEALAVRYAKMGKKVSSETLENEATEAAEKAIFRGKLDPNNLSGQGSVLSFVDRTTQWMLSGRKKLQPVAWYVPFVTTPMNILKQGIEYTPGLGATTLIKSKNIPEQLAKQMIGATVFTGAGILALDGRTTWAAPRGEKEKAQFYAAGMKPYSVKIGDKWYSMAALGPLAYPVAVAAAAKYYHEDSPNSLTDDQMTKIVNSLSGIAGYFSDQSYVQGMGGLIDAVEGQPGSLEQSLTNPARQMIPFGSLLGWVNRYFVDKVYRNPGTGMKGAGNRLIADIPGLSQNLPARKDDAGNPQERKLTGVNSFLPTQVSPSDSAKESSYRDMILRKQEENRRKKLGIPTLRKPRSLYND